MTEEFADGMQPEKHDISFTGERLVPGKVDSSLWYEHISRYIFAAQFTKEKDVLDAGCGAGYGAAYLASHGAHRVSGVDISLEGILYAKAHYSERHLRYCVMDILNLGFAAHSMDVIVSFEVIEHILEQERFLSEISRLLREDGRLIISTPNKGVYRAGLAPNPYHVRELTVAEFKNLLGKYFADVHLVKQNFFWGVELSSIEQASTISSIDRSLSQGDKEPEYLMAVCSQRKPAVDEEFQKIVQVANTSDRYLMRLQAEFEERTEWALQLNEQVQNLTTELNEQVQNLTTAHQRTTRQMEEVSAQYQESKAKLNRLSEELQQTKEQLNRVQHEEQALKNMIGFVDDVPRSAGRITRLPWPLRSVLQVARPYMKGRVPFEFIFRKGLIVASSQTEMVSDLIRATVHRYPFTRFTVLADDRLDETLAKEWPDIAFRFYPRGISRNEKQAVIRSVIQENYDICMILFAGDPYYDFQKLAGLLSGAQYIKVYNEFLNEFYLLAGKPGMGLRHLIWRSNQHTTRAQERILNFRFKVRGVERRITLNTRVWRYLLPSREQIFALLTFLGYCVVLLRVIPLLLNALVSKTRRNPFLD